VVVENLENLLTKVAAVVYCCADVDIRLTEDKHNGLGLSCVYAALHAEKTADHLAGRTLTL